MTGRRVAIALTAALAVMLGAAIGAQADSYKSAVFNGHRVGLAGFQSYGDWFEVCDEEKDNLPVGVRFSYIRKDGTRQTGSHWHEAGVDGLGNRAPEGNFRRRGCSYGNHNFGEGRSVWFQACVIHPGGSETCSPVQRTTA
jgi:hypothetical protein